MNECLIIKRVSNDFDMFVIKNIASFCRKCDVMDVFGFKGRIGRKIISIAKKQDLIDKVPFLLKLNKKTIKQYSTIVLFDDYPDMPLIKWIRDNNPNCEIKMWFWNVPEYPIDEYLKYASLYCFDRHYCENNHIKFEEQFFFESCVDENISHSIERDLLYIGVDKNRQNIIKKVADEAELYDIDYQFILVRNGKKDQISYDDRRIRIYNNPIPYEDVLIEDSKSKAILEIVKDNQTGLTWRALESLYLRRKLVTNNHHIKHTKLYNPHNIFILGIDENKELKRFIESPYQEADADLRYEFSFSRWAKNMGIV